MTLPTHSQIRDAIATWVSSIVGLPSDRTVLTIVPRVVNDGELPSILVRLTNATYDRELLGGSSCAVSVNGQLQVLATLGNLDTEGKAELNAETILCTLRQAAIQVNRFKVMVGGVPKAVDFYILSDTGIIPLQYPVNNDTGRVYAGFTINFTVKMSETVLGSTV